MNASEHVLWSFSENEKMNHAVDNEDWVGQIRPKKINRSLKIENKDEQEILKNFQEKSLYLSQTFFNKEESKPASVFQSYSPFRGIKIVHILIFSAVICVLLYLLFRSKK